MKAACVCTIAGLALSSACEAQIGPEVQKLEYSGQQYRARTATAIIGLTVDGQYVYGQTVELGQGIKNRGSSVVAYDSAQMADTDGDGIASDLVCGDAFPHALSSPNSRYFLNFPMQTNAEDIVPHAGTEGGIVEEIFVAGIRTLCEGVQTEQLTIVFESWEGFGGFGGFDTDGDGIGFPFSRTDADGDTFVDEYLGGILLDFGDLPAVPGGFCYYSADGLSTLGVPLTSNLDLWDNGLPGADGQPDGGVRILWTRGDGGDGMGPLNGGLYPSSFASPLLWGTLAMEVSGTLCPYAGQPGFGVGDSSSVFWSESRDYCDPNGFGNVDDQYDVSFDVADWNSIVQDFQALGPAFRISVLPEPAGSDCCDINQDGACGPADFTSWIAAFNSSASTCDVNQDGSCTPADFTAWIAAFNASMSGAPDLCSF